MIAFIIKTFINLNTQGCESPLYSYIGVHCTHGYNRTGFLIISYLVEIEDWRYDYHSAAVNFICIYVVLRLQSRLSAM